MGRPGLDRQLVKEAKHAQSYETENKQLSDCQWFTSGWHSSRFSRKNTYIRNREDKTG
jgi:hypothetical protein